MTNELEKKFFDTFEIEPKDRFKGCTLGAKYYSEICEEETCKGCDCEIRETVCPQITDRILLELIFLQPLSIEFKYPRNIEELKNTLLGYYIKELSLFAEPSEAEIFKQQVQALFKEGK